MLTQSGISPNEKIHTTESHALANYRAPRTVHYYSEQLLKLFPGERALYDRYIQPGLRILDLGVGGGRTTQYLARDAKRYVGIDFSPEMIECCRKKYPHLEFHVMDAADLSAFPDCSFDCVVFSFNGIDLLYPVAKRAACVAECSRILAPGGMFLLSSHNAHCLILGPDRERLGRRAEELAARLTKRSSAWFGVIRRLLAILGGAYVTIKRSARFGPNRLMSKAFWGGQGYFKEENEAGTGDSLMYAAVPAKIVHDVEEFGFRFLAMTPESPHFRGGILPVWFNYAFQLGAAERA